MAAVLGGAGRGDRRMTGGGPRNGCGAAAPTPVESSHTPSVWYGCDNRDEEAEREKARKVQHLWIRPDGGGTTRVDYMHSQPCSHAKLASKLLSGLPRS